MLKSPRNPHADILDRQRIPAGQVTTGGQKMAGVINVQRRQPKFHSRRDIQLISIIGFLMAAEIALARMESELAELSGRSRKSTAEAITS